MRPVKKSIIDYLKTFVKVSPDKTFYFSETESYTAKKFYERMLSVALFLKEKGVKKGDNVGLTGTRSIDGVALFFAVQYLGAVAVLCDTHADVVTSIKNLGVDIDLALVIDYSENGFTVGGERVPFGSVPVEEAPECDVDVYAPAVVIFTSGSTGVNKGVVLSQYNYVNHQRNFGVVGGYYKGDKAIQMLPIFHIFGLTQVIDSVLRRCPMFFPKAVLPEYILESIESRGITRFGFVPSFALMMADIKAAKGYNTDSLRSVVLAGAPSTKEQFDYLERTLGMDIIPVYGMTELPGITGASPKEEAEKRASSVGKVLPLTKVKIADDGEITAKAPSLFLGYYGEKPTDRRKYFHTGDLGYLDEDGFLHVTGRKKDVIIRNGNNLSALAIEEKLLSLPFVKGAAVVGIEDKVCGEAPAALIVLKNGASLDMVAVEKALNKLEMPKTVKAVEKLPLNGAGKVDKPLIKEMLSE